MGKEDGDGGDNKLPPGTISMGEAMLKARQQARERAIARKEARETRSDDKKCPDTGAPDMLKIQVPWHTPTTLKRKRLLVQKNYRRQTARLVKLLVEAVCTRMPRKASSRRSSKRKV